MSNLAPRRCAICAQKAVVETVIEHVFTAKHDGTHYEVHVPAMPCRKCTACGEVFATEAGELAMQAATRDAIGLMPISRLKKELERLNVSQREFAALCGFAPETVSRWMNGMLPSRSNDKMMRAFVDVPAFRQYLRREEGARTAVVCQFEPSRLAKDAIEWSRDDDTDHDRPIALVA